MTESNNSDIIDILTKKKIKIIEKDLFFKTNDEKIDFLNKLELLEENNIFLKFINNDLIQILLNLEFNKELFEKFRIINWDDFNDLFNKRNLSKREKRIYDNFIEFLKAEFGISCKKKSPDSSLIKEANRDNNKDNKNINEREIKDNILNKPDCSLDENLFVQKENFDLEKDLRDKVKKFDLEVIFDYNEKPHKISVNDFTLYFNQRLRYFTNLLKNRVNMDNVMRISQLRDINDTNSNVSIIGLISDISETKKGHYMITIEDKSGEIKCFVNKEKKELVSMIKNFCLDEGVGIIGKMGDKIIWTDDIVIPSPPNAFDLKRTDFEHYIAVISDLHFGAKVFQDEAFERFLDWINGRTSDEELNKIAKKVKYILIPGDIIEGIGIYPGQGQDARILSSELQYHEATRWLSKIPKDKAIIIIPGNHDIDRLSEPQPKLKYNKAYSLYNMENVIILSNPSRINLFSSDPSGGLEAYMYHGGSIFYYADKIQYLRELGGAKKPEEVIKYLLEKRHLAPSHGATLYIPDSQNDPLVIKKMPDFFITGHTHKMSLANYKGCTIISGGCWVEMSDYQEKMGMFPDVGKCLIVNTKTRKPKILSFYREKHKE